MLEHWNKPFFENASEAVRYVTAELEAAVPTGWSVEHEEVPFANAMVPSFTEPRRTWRVRKEVVMEDFRLYLTPGLDLLIITYGNTDAGAMDLPHQFIERSLVVRTEVLRGWRLRDLLEYTMSKYEPNHWGLT
jgi:hypothetical protein